MNQQPGGPSDSVIVQKATPGDAPALLDLIHGLAVYEKLPPPDPAAHERLTNDLFGPRPRIEAYMGFFGTKAVAYAIVFETYSSFLALPTLYLEDIFVLPEYRSKRVGSTMFKTLLGEALKRGCGRMEWAVLDWNQLAIDFYERIGAAHMKEWLLYRLVRKDMERILKQHSDERRLR
jgi:GNAT superfamily N-acetyltransferase